MVHLLDTNVIIRFLIGDDRALFDKAQTIFKQIEAGELAVVIMESVLMEALFVLTKFYDIDRREASDDLKQILSLAFVCNPDKPQLTEALTLFAHKNIDFVDALLCARKRYENKGILGFDRDIKRCDG